ncbi:MAG: hypothetical protein ISS49_16675 [Anaerolineae bacterium]|nr:hypothetical protein [Anaerolineae bacterium]
MTKSKISNLKSQIAKSIHLILAVCHVSLVMCHWSFARAQDPPPDVRFGAVEAWNDPVAAAEAGVGWERIIFYWSELQRNGPEDWNSYHVPDDRLALAASMGREVVGLLEGTPAWATDGPVYCGVPRGLYLPIDDPGNLWAAFVRRVAGTYAGRVDHWIIWNEPDIAPDTFSAEWCGSIEEYYQLLKVAYLAAHQANPNVVIHMTGLTYFHDIEFGRPYYLKRLLAVAAQDPTGPEHGYYFDVVSLHIYFEIKNFAMVLRDTRATLAAYGLQKPIWVNETDAPPNDDPFYPLPQANFQISLEEQASFLLQAFSLALSEGAERIAVYKWVVDANPPAGREPNGIVRSDHSRRPAYDAYRLVTTHYAGTISAREDRHSLYTVVTLDRGGLTTRVLWARTEADVTVSLPALAAQARLVDQTGAEQSIEPVDGQYTLILPHARCADKRGCIIGGTTYLLVEESGGAPPPAGTVTPAPTEFPVETITPTLTETATITTPLDASTPFSTTTPVPTPTYTPISTLSPTSEPSPTPTPTSFPTPTPTPPPTHTLTPSLSPTPISSPTPTPWPSVPATPGPPVLPVLVGLGTVTLLAALAGTLFKRRGR